MDADLQHPPEVLPRLISAILAGNDLAIGSRYIEGGRLGQWNPVRKFLSAAAVWATWPIQRAGMRARDPMTGFFLIRRECIEGIEFQPSGFKLLLEILVRARLRSVKEVPISFGLRARAPARPTSKWAGITPSSWPGSMRRDSASASAPENKAAARTFPVLPAG